LNENKYRALSEENAISASNNKSIVNYYHYFMDEDGLMRVKDKLKN